MTPAPDRSGARRLAVRVAAVAAAAALAACSGYVASRGFIPDQEAIAAIEPGVTGKREVEDMLGTPSAVGTFRENTWYYVHERTEHTAFFDPEVLDRRIVAVSFDGSDVVSDLQTYTYDDRRDIVPVDRETPTAGSELGLLEQLFGNIGRFNQ